MPALQSPEWYKGGWGRLWSVYSGFFWTLLPTHTFPLLQCGLSMVCSSCQENHLWCRSSKGLQETCSSAWIISFCSSFSDLGSLYCFSLFLFPPPPSTWYFLPYLKYVLTEEPSAWLMGPALAGSESILEPPGTNCVGMHCQFSLWKLQSHWDCILWPVLFYNFINDLKKITVFSL